MSEMSENKHKSLTRDQSTCPWSGTAENQGHIPASSTRRLLPKLGGCWAAAVTTSGWRALGTLVQNDSSVVEQALCFTANSIFCAAVVAAAVLLLASLLQRPVQEQRKPVANRYPCSGRVPGRLTVGLANAKPNLRGSGD
jgi:hypothetical protein